MRPLSPFAIGALLCALPVLGCSSSDAAPDTTASGGSTNQICTAPGYHVDADPLGVQQVNALLVDQAGTAVPGVPVQVCGVNQCYYGNSNGVGRINVVVEEPLVLPVFKYGDGQDFAELGAPLDAAAAQDLGTVVALPLPTLADGAPFPKSGDLSHGDLTLHLGSSTSVTLDLLSYPDDEQHVFRTVPVPLDRSTKALPPSFGFELAYGAAPLLTKFCPAAPLSVKNTLGWDPGTAVEVFIQGLDTNEQWAPYGTWVKVADAEVSSDGSSIDTTSGGIPILSSIALRRK